MPALSSAAVANGDGVDLAIERERRTVAVVVGDRATEAGADEAVVRGEQQRCADGHLPGGDLGAVCGERDGERTSGSRSA
jgi:hypothetical protein